MSATHTGSRRSRRPVVLLDRCIPAGVGLALRHFDIEYTTLADLYGKDRSQDVEDVEWIHDSAEKGMIALTQNFRIARVQHEADAVRQSGARILSYHRAELTKEAKSLILGRHFRAMKRLYTHRGPAFWRISPRNVITDI